MKIRFILYIIFIIYFTVSCFNKTDKMITIIDKFPQNRNITFEEIAIPPILPFVGEMHLLDSILITLDIKADTFFQFFDLPSLRYIGGCVQHGSGPNDEVTILPFLNRLGINSFYYRAINNMKIAQYNTSTKKIEITETILLPDELMECGYLILMNNNIYGYGMISTITNTEFIGFDRELQKVIKFGPPFPYVDMNIPKDKKSLLFTKTVVCKNDGTRLATLYDKFPILRIYDKEGRLIKDVRFVNNQEMPTTYITDRIVNDNTTLNYWKIKATDSYIYGLYVGKTYLELNTRERGLADFANEIHVWDWDGNPIIRFVLNREVFSFAVSTNDDYIICSSIYEDDKLYKFNIIEQY